MRIIILTCSELRHHFFRKYIASQRTIDVLCSFCESQDGNLQQVVASDIKESVELREFHLMIRDKTEQDFFQVFCDTVTDKSNPIFIKKGAINDQSHIDAIIEMSPDLIISYGCSIIKGPLIEYFDKKIINIHLGLSPYYKGAGTNFWPFVNNELTFVGVTFMYLDKGIDTGNIIHQMRPDIKPNDDIHQIGNRLIRDMSKELVKLIHAFPMIRGAESIISGDSKGKVYRMKDYTDESVRIAYNNLKNGIVMDYIKNKAAIDAEFPIVQNPNINSFVS
jgi:phosphoribosylglycinamide formyltransferase-1